MILKNLSVKVGSYEKNGKTVNKWKVIGHIHQGQHGEYMTLDSTVSLAAIARLQGKEGDERISVSMFEPRDDKPQQQAPADDMDINDEIPF